MKRSKKAPVTPLHCRQTPFQDPPAEDIGCLGVLIPPVRKPEDRLPSETLDRIFGRSRKPSDKDDH